MGYGSGQGIEYCPAVHSEVNTVVQAAKKCVCPPKILLSTAGAGFRVLIVAKNL
jgi:deoxycytidylate deaminase